MNNSNHPVAVIGAGPVGLAAAAHLVARGMTPAVLEAGAAAGTSLSAWGHVRVFSPWRYVVDAACSRLLAGSGWAEPDPEALPTGAEIVRAYLAPLAAHPALAPHIRYGARVTAISRAGLDKVTDRGRREAPFHIRYREADGTEHRLTAGAVIDASGSWSRPNPMGLDGLRVPGEEDLADRIAYGIPDVAGALAATYSDRHVLVVGGGHSATNAVLALLDLRQAHPATSITWGLRSNRLDRLLGGGLSDRLPARGALGLAA
ncbi:FAD-dependent oxidoreductase, partial [Rhizobium sp. TRM95111]|uniref:FAD-dependent oxidoreductase n=1 Tax=Rhizobium alarense TaxID=2846851 RepID=UPI001F3ADB86